MAAAAVASVLAVLLLCLRILHVAADSHVSGSAVGFSVELIHRDSPESPFHDPASTPFSRLHAAIHRSAARAKKFRDVAPPIPPHFQLLPGAGLNISALITHYKSDYLMRFYLGTPPKKIFAMVDTGSDLPWVLCSVCKKCYKHRGRLFKPKDSSTYSMHPCLSDACNLLNHSP